MHVKTVLSGAVLTVAAVALIAAQAYFTYAPETEKKSAAGIAPAYTLFENEKAYCEHIKNGIVFDGIELRDVEVKPGSNFWQIARRNGVNIDTLISANPFWQNLDARSRQIVIVPSQVGVLHFINDFSELERIRTMYGVKKEDIIVQKLPFLYSYWYHFKKDRKPVAVFVRDVKPDSSMMVKTLAKNFERREMFRSPLGGRFSSYFGRRLDPIVRTGQFHNGIDIATGWGTPVGAASDGVISDAGWMGGYGKAVIINHSKGYRTLYGHMSSITVRPGQKVKAGMFVGRVGSTGWSTGPHLHFTVWQNGVPINPMQILW